MKRRSFIGVGLLGSALLVVGGGAGLALRSGDSAVKPKRALQVLTPTAFPVMVAVAARVMLGTTGDPIEIAHRVDETLRFAPKQAQRDMNLVLGLFENALTGLLTRGQPTPFTLLSEADQDAALKAWRDSRVATLRGAYHGLRKLSLAAHYASPDAFAEVKYPGPSITKVAPPAMSARGALVVPETPSVEDMPQ
jgi:hypothetical protein